MQIFERNYKLYDDELLAIVKILTKLLWLKTKSKVKRETLYWVNIRELDRVLDIKYLSYIHLANSPYYTKPSLF